VLQAGNSPGYVSSDYVGHLQLIRKGAQMSYSSLWIKMTNNSVIVVAAIGKPTCFVTPILRTAT